MLTAAQRYLPRLEWTATDDLGTPYAARNHDSPRPPHTLHYVKLTPTSGTPARDRQLVLRAVRAFVPSERTWSLVVELH